jgi:HEAT repeat protein
VRAEALRSDAGIVGSLVVPVAARGLVDEGVDVRRACLETLREAGAAVNALVHDARLPDQPLDQLTYQREAEAERAALEPVVLTLQAHALAVGRLLTDEDSDIRRTALKAFEEFAHARRRLEDRAESSLSSGRGQPLTPPTTTLLNKHPPGQGMPLDALTPLVRNADVQVRLTALEILEALGPDAAPAAPAVINALSDPSRFVRWAAARALARIGPAEPQLAVPALTELLRDPDGDLRLAAVQTLARYGPAARPALLPLTAALVSESPAMRVAALRALDTLGNDAEPALAAIRDALDDHNALVRQSAARLLGKFGPSARDALNSLRSRLEDSSPEVRMAAQEALRRITVPK